MNRTRDDCRRYIAQAAVEYLIAIMVGGSFLATLTSSLGMSDGLTGVITSFLSLGCVFQLGTAFTGGPTKRMVLLLSVGNQLLFALLYVIPLLGGPKSLRTAGFIAAILLAYFLYNLAAPRKTVWLMSLVDDAERGRFTAKKEIVSLAAGMAFTYALGAWIDHCRAAGQLHAAFAGGAAGLLALTAVHTALLARTTAPAEHQPPAAAKSRLRLPGRAARRAAIALTIWGIAANLAVPFYGTYQLNELGFSMTYISVLQIVQATARIFVSRAWGAYADRHSFAAMLRRCLLVMACAFLINTFAAPGNGAVLFLFYNILYGIAMGGLNSALTNLIFDSAPKAECANALAFSQVASGAAGFAAALAASAVVRWVQGQGSRLLGITVYAQQLLSLAACAATVAAALYIRFAFRRSGAKEAHAE